MRDTRSTCGGPLTEKEISGVEVAPCLLPKISGVKVTPSVNSVESSEQLFWRKIRQIWRICEPWIPMVNYYSINFCDTDTSFNLNIVLSP